MRTPSGIERSGHTSSCLRATEASGGQENERDGEAAMNDDTATLDRRTDDENVIEQVSDEQLPDFALLVHIEY